MKLNFYNVFKFILPCILFSIITSIASAQTATPTADQITGTISEVSALKGSLFGKKVRDTVFVFISNIKYTDPNLALLKTNITKKKEDIKSSLKDGIVILKVIGKSDASTVYDSLNKDLQKLFEASNMEDNKLILEYKQE